jgi:hypothetical protein
LAMSGLRTMIIKICFHAKISRKVRLSKKIEASIQISKGRERVDSRVVSGSLSDP